MNKLTLFRLLGTPKTILFNFRHLPFKQAKKLPIRFGTRVKTEIDKSAKIIIESDNIKKGMIQMGIGYGSLRRGEKLSSSLIMKENTKLIFRGTAVFQRGGYVQLDAGAEIDIGNKFSANSNFVMNSDYKVQIGESALFGWNNTVMGADGHDIIDQTTGEVTNSKKPITIGSNVWICSEAHILKGAEIPDGCIVGYRSLVTGKHTEPNTLMVGNPAKEVANNRKIKRD